MAHQQSRQRKPGRKEPKEYEEDVIQIDRVTRVVKGGRRLRFRATVVVGNKKGRVALGIGKSTEVAGAIQKAIQKAKKDFLDVPLVASSTIPHRIEQKFKSAKILLIPAGEGTGIIAGGSIRKVVELAGIKNILSKALGTTNRLTNAQAAIAALRQLQDEAKLDPKILQKIDDHKKVLIDDEEKRQKKQAQIRREQEDAERATEKARELAKKESAKKAIEDAKKAEEAAAPAVAEEAPVTDAAPEETPVAKEEAAEPAPVEEKKENDDKSSTPDDKLST